MGGKEGSGADALANLLDHGTGDRQSIECTGAATDLIQDDQTARGRVTEDAGRLHHLDQEGARASGDIVLGTDTREDAIDQANPRGTRGHEAADLSHEDDQGNLAQVRRFAGHVRAGQDHEELIRRPQMAVIRDESAGREMRLDDGVASLDDLEVKTLIDNRAAVAPLSGQMCQGREDIQMGEAARGRPQAVSLRRDAPQEPLVDLLGELLDPLLGLEDLALPFLEARRDEALGLDQRLLPMVIRRNKPEVRAGHLQIVAEDLVVADLQGFDAGTLALDPLELGDPLPCPCRRLNQRIELGAVAGPNQGATVGRRDCLIDQIGDIKARIEDRGTGPVQENSKGCRGGAIIADCPGWRRASERIPETSGGPERRGQPKELARPGQSLDDAPGQTLQVADLTEQVPQTDAGIIVLNQGCDCVQARLDHSSVAERLTYPASEKPPAHRRARLIEDGKEAAVDPTGAAVAEKVEVPPGGPVDGHAGASRIDPEVHEVWKETAVILIQVVQDGRSRAEGKRVIGGAKSLE